MVQPHGQVARPWHGGLAKCGHYFSGMLAGLDLRENLPDRMVRLDEIGTAHHARLFLPQKFLLLPDAVVTCVLDSKHA